MARFKLTPAQVVSISEAITVLDNSGSYYTPDMVFGEYDFYRRQDEATRQVETLEQFLKTLDDVRGQVDALKGETDDELKKLKMLESDLATIISSAKMTNRRHKAARLARRVGDSIFGSNQ